MGVRIRGDADWRWKVATFWRTLSGPPSLTPPTHSARWVQPSCLVLKWHNPKCIQPWHTSLYPIFTLAFKIVSLGCPIFIVCFLLKQISWIKNKCFLVVVLNSSLNYLETINGYYIWHSRWAYRYWGWFLPAPPTVTLTHCTIPRAKQKAVAGAGTQMAQAPCALVKENMWNWLLQEVYDGASETISRWFP